MMKIDVEWFENGAKGNFPKYMRLIGKGSDGTVYLPIDISNERNAFLLALDDRVGVTYQEHIYVPSTWLSETFPQCKEVCDAAVNMIKKFLDDKNE